MQYKNKLKLKNDKNNFYNNNNNYVIEEFGYAHATISCSSQIKQRFLIIINYVVFHIISL